MVYLEFQRGAVAKAELWVLRWTVESEKRRVGAGQCIVFRVKVQISLVRSFEELVLCFVSRYRSF
jgi:hypothetical protein